VSQQVGASLGLAVMVTVFGAATTRAPGHVSTGVDAARRAEVVLGHGTSAVLTGSAISIRAALLVVLLMVRTRSAPQAPSAAAIPVLAEGDSGLETLATLLGTSPTQTTRRGRGHAASGPLSLLPVKLAWRNLSSS
jgi:hypothetical protein